MSTPAQQVEQQINEDLEKFKNSIYKGTIDVPQDILTLFRKGVMALAPQFHKFLANRINVISNTEVNELTVEDLNCVITIILNTCLRDLYDDFAEAMYEHVKLEKFVLSYNQYVSKFQEDLKSKKITLLSIAGAKNNNLRVIN